MEGATDMVGATDGDGDGCVELEGACVGIVEFNEGADVGIVELEGTAVGIVELKSMIVGATVGVIVGNGTMPEEMVGCWVAIGDHVGGHL